MTEASLQPLLSDWESAVAVWQRVHFESAKHYRNLNVWLGAPAVALSAVVGTAVFATLGKDVHLGWRIIVGLVSVLAAVLTALQTFLKFGELAEKHRAAGARYGAVKREIQQHRSTGAADEGTWVDQIRARIDSLAEQSPEVSSRMWRRLSGPGQAPSVARADPGARADSVFEQQPWTVSGGRIAEIGGEPVTGVRMGTIGGGSVTGVDIGEIGGKPAPKEPRRSPEN